MPVNSKQKGKRFELELVHVLNALGFNTRRTAQYCGNTGEASDVTGLKGIHVEAKHQETMHLYDWMAQAIRDSKGTGEMPAVFHRKNNAETLVTMRIMDWIELYKGWVENERQNL